MKKTSFITSKQKEYKNKSNYNYFLFYFYNLNFHIMRNYRNFDYCPGIHTKFDSETLMKKLGWKVEIKDILKSHKKQMKDSKDWKWTQQWTIILRLIEAWDQWTPCYTFFMIDWIWQYWARIRELRHVLNNVWFDIVCFKESRKKSSYMLVKTEE